MEILSGYELGQSNYLCIKHFNPNDLQKKGVRHILTKGSLPDPARISIQNPVNSDSIPVLTNSLTMDNAVSIESSHPIENEVSSNDCESCQFLRIKIEELKEQIVLLKAEHSVKLSSVEIALKHEQTRYHELSKVRRSLKKSLTHLKNKEIKLKNVIDDLKEENLISDEAASNLNVIQLY